MAQVGLVGDLGLSLPPYRLGWLEFIPETAVEPRISRMGTDNQSLPKNAAFLLEVRLKRWVRPSEVSESVVGSNSRIQVYFGFGLLNFSFHRFLWRWDFGGWDLCPRSDFNQRNLRDQRSKTPLVAAFRIKRVFFFA
jgi:hypothetical protein